MAFEDNTDAPMTMPGTRTSREMVRASRFRIDISPAEEWRRSWCSGRATSFVDGYTILCVHFFRAASNYSSISSMALQVILFFTSGIISAGSVTSLCANSSLKEMRCPTSTSQ